MCELFAGYPHEITWICPTDAGETVFATEFELQGQWLAQVLEGEGQICTFGETSDYQVGWFVWSNGSHPVRFFPSDRTKVRYLRLKNAQELLNQTLGDSGVVAMPIGCEGGHMLKMLSLCLCLDGEKVYQASAGAFSLLMILCRDRFAQGKQYSTLVIRAAELIEQNCAFISGVEELAQMLSVSKGHLIRLFSEQVGMPPGKFLQNKKIQLAKYLLLSRDYPIETVANMAGFAGANYFCKVFRRETGQSPLRYRQGGLYHDLPTFSVQNLQKLKELEFV